MNVRRALLAVMLLIAANLTACAFVPMIQDKNVGYGTTQGQATDATMPAWKR